ncbi:MAG TPA: hypothetical protein VGM90_26010 [Kofleriaceae bacterium]|jgi:hypothetical protein
MSTKRGWGITLVVIAWTGCLYDDGDRCDDHMHYQAEVHACVCDADSIAVATGCQPCADDQIVDNNVCVCADGSPVTDAGCTP